MNIRKPSLWLLPAITLSILLNTSSAQEQPLPTPVNYESVKNFVTKLIRKEMKKQDVTGLSIALVDDQQVVWAEGFGYSDEEREIPATAETIYRVGSLTKLFTATAAMQLAEQGKLDIDRPLKDYVPEFSIKTRFNGAGPITLRQLLTHHAGLPSNIQKGMWSNRPGPYTNVVNELKDEYAAYPPGYLFSYSNIGMDLLGIAIERASGRDYASFIQESLLEPLNMKHTAFSPAKKTNTPLSKGYHKGRETVDPLLRDVPAGGMESTALDLGRFMQMAFAQGRSNNRQLVRPETLSEMMRPQNTDVPLDLGLRVGLGWMLSGLGDIDIQNAGIVAHHAGATLLFHSQMIILPQYKLGVVVLANSSSASRVVSKTAVRAITLALETKAGIKQPALTKPVETEDAPSQRVLQDSAGLYASIAGLAEIRARSDHLHAEIMNRTFQLVPHGHNRFGVKYRWLGMIPISLGELDYYEISHSTIEGREILKAGAGGREILIAEKIHPVAVPEAWLRREGEYRIDNLGDDFPLIEDIRLRCEDGLLLAEYAIPLFFKGAVRFPLIPLSDTEAVIAGLGRGMGETIRAVTVNNREYLFYSGYLLRKNE